MAIDLKAHYQNVDDILTDLVKYEVRVASGFIGLETSNEDEPDFLADIDDIFTHRPGTAEAVKRHAPGAAAGEVKAVKQRQLLCVESQKEIQDALRKSLSRLGYRIILVGDAEVAAERYRETPSDAVLFDLDGLGPEGINALTDMHEKAREDGRPLTALVLLGPRQAALREQLPVDDSIVVLSKPVKMKQVQHAVTKLLPVK